MSKTPVEIQLFSICYAQEISQIQRNNITNLRIKHTEVTEKFLDLKGRFPGCIFIDHSQL